jgi:endonuclease/exonuclease/phosphatase family metal-dependent hydrolase
MPGGSAGRYSYLTSIMQNLALSSAPLVYFVFFVSFVVCWPLRAQVPVVVQSNVTVRIMAANLSSGNYQRYETAGLRIFKGLKPDIVAIQEFNYASPNGRGTNTAAAFREMVDGNFGTNFSYFRESGSGYTIPNGIISRWPIRNSGSWEDVDTGVNDRGFAWAQIALPGSNDLYVVSIHLKASSDTNSVARRAVEATNLVNLIRSQFPTNAWLAVGGDCNIYAATESAYRYLASQFSDEPTPADAVAGGNANTNEARNRRYDYLFLSQAVTNHLASTVLASRTFPGGLVFDSAVYTPLSDVSPVTVGDSHVTGMQHMGVVRDLAIRYAVTNYIVQPPVLTLQTGTNGHYQLSFTGVAGKQYVVQASTNLVHWVGIQTNTYPFTLTQTNVSSPQARFYRVALLP